MKKAMFVGVTLLLFFLHDISLSAERYRTVQQCVEVQVSDINREIYRLKSKCSDEIRYINNCIKNPDQARGSRDHSRSRGDWLKLKKQVESRCEGELAALNRQKSEVWKFCKDTVDVEGVTDLLGAMWEVMETGISGTWKRRGKSNVFDGKWNDGSVAELTITLSGKEVRILRKDVSGPNAGQTIDYEGAISEDGKSANGTMKSIADQAPWSAVIRQ